jgi:hypothetical protein
LRYRAEALLTDETKVNYPIGRNLWSVSDRKCGSFAGTDDLVTITTCSEEQFTCSDGTCQPLVNRCDLKADCEDRSDEEACRKVHSTVVFVINMHDEIIHFGHFHPIFHPIAYFLVLLSAN